ncbi:MAG: hypothetical protein A3G28_07090 [Betaproteobacteria bacterium RIFCSPLOWO2_12_FULL_68_19]|nr:MAG: hypothetical protein A3G28_07090 [Betaproteobacteria bacterium RIFCSPLOWO2_12_FULL_68_19]
MELAPESAEEAYAIQDVFVALRAEKLGAIAGYKVALASAAMRRFVGVEEPQLGAMFQSTLHRTPARVRAAGYVHLIVEFEIGVQIAEDLPAAGGRFFWRIDARERAFHTVRHFLTPRKEILVATINGTSGNDTINGSEQTDALVQARRK